MGLSVFFRAAPGPWAPELLLGISTNTEAGSVGFVVDLDETFVGRPPSIILLSDDVRLPFLQSVTVLVAVTFWTTTSLATMPGAIFRETGTAEIEGSIVKRTPSRKKMYKV